MATFIVQKVTDDEVRLDNWKFKAVEIDNS